MNKLILGVNFFVFIFAFTVFAADKLETDTFKTSAGELKITFIGHGSLMFTFGGKVIHVDPTGQMGDYAKMPKADVILITHDHPDHLDVKTIGLLKKVATELILTESCAGQVKGGAVMKNGDKKVVSGVKIEAVPAYNLVHMYAPGQPFHPKGAGNGYVLTFGDKRVYVAGDTENIPEMKALAGVDCAFLPMNLPYTMTPEMVADAAKILKPKILYPYHYGETDTSKIVALLKDMPGIEVRIRKLK
ncbi:MAG: MBL fold metallo-hydrolase [Deltaproteobacteria bacterium]|nr:MBL fold metallo-hydrolase [Deltaproteobacteria bacterium]